MKMPKTPSAAKAPTPTPKPQPEVRKAEDREPSKKNEGGGESSNGQNENREKNKDNTLAYMATAYVAYNVGKDVGAAQASASNTASSNTAMDATPSVGAAQSPPSWMSSSIQSKTAQIEIPQDAATAPTMGM